MKVTRKAATRKAAPPRAKGVVSHTAELVRVSKGLAYVRNGRLEARVGEQVSFKNSTDRTAHLYFPEPKLFNELRGTGQLVEVAAGKRSEPFTVSHQTGTGARVEYEYAFFSHATRNFAVGGSNPKIIILTNPMLSPT